MPEEIASTPALGMSPASVTPALVTLDGIEPMPEIAPVPEVLTPLDALKLPSTCATPPFTAKLVTEAELPEGI